MRLSMFKSLLTGVSKNYAEECRMVKCRGIPIWKLVLLSSKDLFFSTVCLIFAFHFIQGERNCDEFKFKRKNKHSP